MARILIFTLAFLLSFGIEAQSIKPSFLVQSAKQAFIDVPLFSNVSVGSRTSITKEVEPLAVLDINTEMCTKLVNSNDKYISLRLPNDEGGVITLDLVEVSPLASDFVVKSAPSMQVVKVATGRHFRGMIRGVSNSVAAISIFENEVMGLISHPRASGNMVLGRLENSTQYILYQDDQLPQLAKECATKDEAGIYTREQTSSHDGERALTDCVRLYLEVDNDIYINKGSSNANVTTFVTGIFNQVSTLYANEQINTVISEIVIWSTTSPYNATTSTGMLNAFTAYRQGFNGNLAQLLSYRASGGVAYVDGLCRTNPDFSMSYAGINSTFQNVPTYSWTVEVCAHEFGHLFGSQHTHACVWNGNGTAIDGCYATEGGCSNPGLPSNGGTVMSYCHLTSAGINFANGFGTQPGNVMRSEVTVANCLQACSGGGGGGGGTPPCTQNQLVLTLRTDNYPSETSWNIKNAAGTILFSGSGYTAANTVHTINLCLATACFTFTINDQYGDGICCTYGQGYYNIKQGTTTLISGGAFGTTETKSFCASGTPPTPSCTDGVQNNGETGIDCGGPNCAACPTCNDGIKNGSETGVDCGGNCPPCPTCNDGIQNGSETGVDCGGNCPACPTCSDGIQNGGETGVDCGGPNCAPCNTGGGGSGGNVQVTNIAGHFFESGWDGWIDGGIDAFRYSGNQSPEGLASIRLRDNEAVFSSMTSPTYNLTTFDSVTVQFKARATSMEAGKDFWLRYFNGSVWTTVKAYVSGVDFTNDNIFTRKFKINGPLSAAAAFRFQADADDNNDLIYIDAVEIKAYKTVGTPTSSCTDGIKNGQETGVDCGGPTCPACPTCSDGVQNGNETGVDCGGSCPPCNTGGGSGTPIAGYYFEAGWDSWLDGGVDCFRYSGTMSAEGLFSIRLRDNSGLESAMTSPTVNLTGFSTVKLQFKFRAEGMETGEDFFVQYFNGSTWSTIATLAAGTNFNNLTSYTVDLNLTGGLSANAMFRFMCDASENDDMVYIDAVVLTGFNGQMKAGLPGMTISQESSDLSALTIAKVQEVSIYPNPTNDLVNIASTSVMERIKVISVTGQEIINVELEDNTTQIDMSQFNSGIYLILIYDENGVTSKRIIKQ
jgi:hypothetical protein